ncbi:MAG: hypothetical protein COS08_06660 [Euryarchaeota archaeon CG01_land_8_20_14_3_00_38_12]|nr:MAG: hypothetical protein COS08_06660 [Euryarchaeota archaeon CG01_land_8_20_14_3_00_38_12]PJB21828.1 MAG: hypothetical protein CO114_03285 [Euryarchaeota archaeon CG_4_9_14_3_um_filter_38_12]
MKIDKALGAAIIAIIILGSLTGGFAYLNLTATPKEVLKEGAEISATISINFTNGNVLGPYNITTKNATVYGFLLEAAKPENGNFTVKATYWGSYDSMFVDSIAGAEGGQDGKWWQYYVNGELPMVGCDKYIVQNNDYIEWKFEVPAWG